MENHPGQLCRLCANITAEFTYIFGSTGMKQRLADKINTCLPVTVRETDPLPKQLCASCVLKLDVCHEFSEICVQAEDKLKILCEEKKFISYTLGSTCPSDSSKNLEAGGEELACRFQNDFLLQENSQSENQKNLRGNCVFTDGYGCPLCCRGSMVTESKNTNIMEEAGEFSNRECKTSKCLVCDICSKKFNSKKTLTSHKCSASTKSYKCNLCDTHFRTKFRLLFHELQHQDGNPVTCIICQKEFSREGNLYDHVRLVHMGEKRYCCDKCGKTFQLKSRLVAHQRVHLGERPFKCDICDGKFYNKETLKNHQKTHTNEKPFQCEKCGRCFARKTLFHSHLLSHISQENKPPKLFSCRSCDVTFQEHDKLQEHKKIVHPDSMVGNVSTQEHLSKPFQCPVCNKSFVQRISLITHSKVHSGDLPFQCDYCDKKFVHKTTLLLHRRTHTGEKPHQCGTCGKCFIQSAHLYAHERIHTGEKPYVCEFCGDSFRLKHVRDAHRRKHTGERPYKCSVCEKAFRTSHSYYQHMWIHQGKKPYPCKYCGKSFRRSNGLKVHIRVHTGERPHACDICGRCFAQKQDMRKHRTLHTAGKLL